MAITDDGCADLLRLARFALRRARDQAPRGSFAKDYARDAISAVNSALFDRRQFMKWQRREDSASRKALGRE